MRLRTRQKLFATVTLRLLPTLRLLAGGAPAALPAAAHAALHPQQFLRGKGATFKKHHFFRFARDNFFVEKARLFYTIFYVDSLNCFQTRPQKISRRREGEAQSVNNELFFFHFCAID